MIHVEREQLPESYLLILEDGEPGPEVALERALLRGARSGKPALWVDCSLLSSLSDEAADLLMAYQAFLPSLHVDLVLSHVGEPVLQALQLAARRETLPRVVASLLDAQHPQSGD